MIAVRYAALAALAVWLGGMLVLGWLVAPTITGIWSTGDPALSASPEAALGGYFRLLHLLSYTCGAVVLVCLLVMKFVGPPPIAFKMRAALVSVMLAVAVYSDIPLGREMRGLRPTAANATGDLTSADARYVRLGWLHQVDLMLMSLNIVLGTALLYWYVRE